MKLLRSLTLAAVLLVVGSTAATAQYGVNWQETLKFKSGGSEVYNGVYVGPYQAWETTNFGGAPVIDIFCVDYSHEIHVNDVWTANFEDLAHGNLALTRLGFGQLPGPALTAVQTKYAEMAWLASQFKITNPNQWGDIDYAIWNISNPGIVPLSNAAIGWKALAVANYGSVDLAGWAVVTDVLAQGETPAGTQEYLTQNPEPATLLLLGTGLLGLVAVGFVKRSSV